MASKRRVRRTECGKKRKFTTAHEANSFLAYMHRTKGEVMHTYRCPHCAHYHVGHFDGTPTFNGLTGRRP
jgi:hypothetical protein